MRSQSKIPFDFIFDYLNPEKLRIKPMFGCFAVYSGNKLVFLLRDRKEKTELNGVWLASSIEMIGSLCLDLLAINPQAKLVPGKKSNGTWLLISKNSNEFETSVIFSCQMVSNGDKRIGKITASSITNK